MKDIMFVGKAKSKFIRVSPYKLRPVADVIRGYEVNKAIAWLGACGLKRAQPIAKTLVSAYSNAKNLHPDAKETPVLFIKEIKIDQGPVIRYYKPGAMGRASMQRKRLSHIEIMVGIK